MLLTNVDLIVMRIEDEFMPDEYRIMTKLSKGTMFHHVWPNQKIWRRADGSSWRDMHSIEVMYGVVEKVDDATTLIDAFWAALINNFEGDLVEFSGPFPSSEWRPAFKHHYSAIYVKFEHAVAFGSLGILKNDVWNIRD